MTNVHNNTYLVFTCSKSIQELLAQCVKSFRYLYGLLCTDFIHCSAVSTVDSEQVDTGWVVT